MERFQDDFSGEIWLPVPHKPFNKSHEVSNLGRVRRVIQSWSHVPKILPGCVHNNGYRHSLLTHHGTACAFLTHRLVAEAFIGPCPRGHQVNHKNFDRLDNRVENLEWVTPRENLLHSDRNGRKPKGSAHGNAKLNETLVAELRRRFMAGESIRSFARKYGVSRMAIKCAIRRRTWKHVI